MKPIGYLIVGYNRASRMPEIPVGAAMHWSLGSAQDELDSLAEETTQSGRLAPYEVVALVHVDEVE